MLVSLRVAVALLVAQATSAFAEAPRSIVGFRVEGHSKVSSRTLGYLTHVHLGDQISAEDLPAIQTALISSELFKSAIVRLEDAPGGAIVVATLDDKWSWIAAPTLYVSPTTRAFGGGFVENDFGGRDQKLLLYGQLGTQRSLVFGTFLDPAVHGTKLTYRIDLYAEHKVVDEYANPPNLPTSLAVTRETTQTFLDAGALVWWSFRWWLVGDFRLRGAYVYYRDPHDPNTGVAAPAPETDGWDVSAQARLTLDRRINRFGVRWGPYVQLELEQSVPGLDSYGFEIGLVRAYYSWRLFCEHELELRVIGNAGYHLPLNEELTLGGATDLRGYDVDQFRGDVTGVVRAEYSVPIVRWWVLAFRALAFCDSGYSGFHFRRGSDRDYLPGDLGAGVFRDDVGGGLRVYVENIVVPLLGLDVGYGIQGHSPELYFELGLTDF